MHQRFRQILLLGSVSWVSWLAMMLLHEAGHIIGAIGTGGVVRQLVWFPTVLSRTDVSPNPHPLLETWACPVFGSLLPMLLAILLMAIRAQVAYLFFAGFCLIANGAYLGVGSAWPVGDAKTLVDLGVPRIALGAFGIVAVMSGFFILDRVSPRFGFGRSPVTINARHVLFALFTAALFTIICWAGGRSGL